MGVFFVASLLWLNSLVACNGAIVATAEPTVKELRGSPALSDNALASLTKARVTGVLSGDTISVAIDDREFQVVYAGIDAPNLNHVGSNGSFGQKSRDANERLVSGRVVYLEQGESGAIPGDHMSSYVWTEDGMMVNGILVSNGYARVSADPLESKYLERLLAYERLARDYGWGLWDAIEFSKP